MSFETLYAKWQALRPKAQTAQNYFDAVQTPRNTSILAPPSMRIDYYTSTPWSRVATTALEERITIADIDCRDGSLAEYLRSAWFGADGDRVSSRTHLLALMHGRSYVAVSSRADGSPDLTCLSALETVHTVDPATGVVNEVLRVYGNGQRRATHYLPGKTVHYVRAGDFSAWQESRTVSHQYGRLFIVPFVNTAFATDAADGSPEARSLWHLQDSATRIATDMSIAAALMAVPQRIILGATDEEADEGAVQLYMSRMLMFRNSDAKVEQFSAAQLQQFGTALVTLARVASTAVGIPVSLFGVSSEANPSSGDAMREDDSRITKRAERLTREFTPAWQSVLSILADFYPGHREVSDEDLQSISPSWRDPSRPTLAMLADFGQKLATASYDGRPLFSREFIYRKMGMTSTEILDELDRVEEDPIRAIMREGGDDDPPSPGEDQ